MAQGEFWVERQNWARWPKVIKVNRVTESGTEMRRYVRKPSDFGESHEYALQKIAELKAENARLQSELESVGTAAYLYGRGDLRSENAKLRELVCFIMHQCNDGNPRCDECIEWNDCECVALQRMRELGVEVDG